MEESATDWRAWGFYLALFSLGYNIFNTYYTRRVGKRASSRAVKLDEFRTSIRNPIHTVLDELDAIGRRAYAQARAGNSIPDAKDSIADLNRDVIHSLGVLSDRLSDANNSKFTSEINWLANFATHEDMILSKFDRALNPTTEDVSAREALSNIQDRIKKLRFEILKMLESESEIYAG